MDLWTGEITLILAGEKSAFAHGLLSLPRSYRFNLPNSFHVGASALRWGECASFGCICSPLCSPLFPPRVGVLEAQFSSRDLMSQNSIYKSVSSFDSFGTLQLPVPKLSGSARCVQARRLESAFCPYSVLLGRIARGLFGCASV